MSSAKQFDKYYTKPEVVEKCISLLSLDKYNTILEPSAGSGNFSNILKNYGNVIAIDIEPENENVLKSDFLKDSLTLENNTLVVGNPPFGRQCSLAIKFFNKAASYPNVSTISFILPKSFKKESMKNKLDKNFSLQLSMDLEEFSFTFKDEDYNVPSVFQIWNRTHEPRQKNTKKILNEKMSFLKLEETENSSISIRRVGINAGKASWFNNQSKQSHYFLKTQIPENVIDYLNSIEWEHNDTTGPRSISKQQFIEVLNRYQ